MKNFSNWEIFSSDFRISAEHYRIRLLYYNKDENVHRFAVRGELFESERDRKKERKIKEERERERNRKIKEDRES